MVYGYARVSTSKQVKGNSLQEQKDLLMQAGVPEENIVCDVYTGTKTERPEFTKLIDRLQSGDKLVVTKMDRFARTASEGSVLVKELNEKGVIFHILNMGTADSTPMGKLMVHMLLAFAEFERDMILERQREGIAIAKAVGKYKGRKEITVPNIGEYYEKYMSRQGSKVSIAAELGISRTTLDKLFKKYVREQKLGENSVKTS